jgi:hypothetical protein
MSIPSSHICQHNLADRAIANSSHFDLGVWKALYQIAGEKAKKKG